MADIIELHARRTQAVGRVGPTRAQFVRALARMRRRPLAFFDESQMPESGMPIVYPLAPARGVTRWVYAKRCEMPGCFARALLQMISSANRREIRAYDMFCAAHAREGYAGVLNTINRQTEDGALTYEEVSAIVEQLRR